MDENFTDIKPQSFMDDRKSYVSDPITVNDGFFIIIIITILLLNFIIFYYLNKNYYNKNLKKIFKIYKNLNKKLIKQVFDFI